MSTEIPLEPIAFMHSIPSFLVVTNDTKARKRLRDELLAANEETERMMNGAVCVFHDEVPALLDEASVDIHPVDDVMHNELPWQVCEEPVQAKYDRAAYDRAACVRMCFFYKNQISETYEESLDEEEVEFQEGCERDMEPLFGQDPVMNMELEESPFSFCLLTKHTDIKKPVSMIYKELHPDVSLSKQAAPHSLQN